MVGLHTCGDLASSTLRMFVGRQELRAICSVGCCYNLLSEEFDQKRGLQSPVTGEMQPVPGKSQSHSHCYLIHRMFTV